MLLDLLFRRRKYEEPDDDENSEPELNTSSDAVTRDISAFVSSRLNEKMPVSILAEDGKVLFSGRIVKGSQVRLEIGRLAGALSLKSLTVGSHITFMAYNVDLVKVRVDATVDASTATCLVLRDWELRYTPAHRSAPRLPMNMPAKMYALTDSRLNESKDCTILDLSLTGACIRTLESLTVGDQFKLRFEVFKGDGVNTCHAQVVWVKSEDGINFTYGLLFAELERWRRRNLEGSLEDLLRQLESKTAS